jgi:hypothetical protein
MEASEGFTFVRNLAYQGKEGCEDVRCRRFVGKDEDGKWSFGPCLGWHCSVCHEPCSMMGHPHEA